MKKGRLHIVAAGLFFLSFAAWIVFKELKYNNLEVVFFDIGQGDSIYIEVGGDFQILIDGGPTSAILEKIGREMPFYDRQIELLVLTHPDHDHLFGLLEVLRNYQVKNILWTGVVKDTAEYREWIKLIEEENADIIIAQFGQKIIFPSKRKSDFYLLVLHPFESIQGREEKRVNDTSAVIQLVFGDNSFLMTGDISKKVEKQLVQRYKELKSDVLKVAHHGSKSSSCIEFIEAVNPKVAVISAGENNWGHPSQEVLQRLAQFDIDILITKEIGDIKFAY